MTLSRPGADEAHAIALLQQLAVMCDETRHVASDDPVRITAMLAVFEETLATLAPVLERLGASPSAARDAVLSAARQAVSSHGALADAMTAEIARLGRAITDTEHAAQATQAYASHMAVAARTGFEAQG